MQVHACQHAAVQGHAVDLYRRAVVALGVQQAEVDALHGRHAQAGLCRVRDLDAVPAGKGQLDGLDAPYMRHPQRAQRRPGRRRQRRRAAEGHDGGAEQMRVDADRARHDLVELRQAQHVGVVVPSAKARQRPPHGLARQGVGKTRVAHQHGDGRIGDLVATHRSRRADHQPHRLGDGRGGLGGRTGVAVADPHQQAQSGGKSQWHAAIIRQSGPAPEVAGSDTGLQDSPGLKPAATAAKLWAPEGFRTRSDP